MRELTELKKVIDSEAKTDPIFKHNFAHHLDLTSLRNADAWFLTKFRESIESRHEKRQNGTVGLSFDGSIALVFSVVTGQFDRFFNMLNEEMKALLIQPARSNALPAFAPIRKSNKFQLDRQVFERSHPSSRILFRAGLPETLEKANKNSAFSDIHMKSHIYYIVNYQACKNLIAAFESQRITVDDLLLLEMIIDQAREYIRACEAGEQSLFNVGHGDHAKWNVCPFLYQPADSSGRNAGIKDCIRHSCPHYPFCWSVCKKKCKKCYKSIAYKIDIQEVLADELWQE